MKYLFINGKIFTSDTKHPYADAMVVQDGKILWVGEKDTMPATWKEEIASVTDLEGRRVIPGFVDAHMHPVMLALFDYAAGDQFDRRAGIRDSKETQPAARRCVDSGLGL